MRRSAEFGGAWRLRSNAPPPQTTPLPFLPPSLTQTSKPPTVFGTVGATIVGATIASRALDQLDDAVDPALAQDEAGGGMAAAAAAGQQGRRRRMTLDEAEALKQQQQQQEGAEKK